MNKLCLPLTALLILVTISGCSKRNHPSVATSSTDTKTVTTATVKTALPKVIVVNDKAAKRSVDGRYYYDLDGQRYWRNNKDGKYYLFNKSMFENDDFKAPSKQ
jgi:hypothetical protein